MTTAIDYPRTLPLPLVPGYGLRRRPNILRTEKEDGHARQRRRTIDSPSDYPVVFEFTAAEYMVFDSWFHYDAADGAAWFNIELLAAIGLANHEARVKEGKLDDDLLPGGNWRVACVLETRQRPMLDPGVMALLANDTADALLAAMAAFHTLVETQLWPD